MADDEEGSTTTLFPKEAEKIWINLQTSQQVLHMHSGEYPDKLHRSVVWKRHHSGQEGSPAQLICGVPLPPLQDIYSTRVRKRTHNIIKDKLLESLSTQR